MKVDGDGWPQCKMLVMADLADHEKRLDVIEKALVEMKLDMVRMMMKYSFLGSLAATAVVVVPAFCTWYFGK